MRKLGLVLVVLLCGSTDGAVITWNAAQDTTSSAANDVADGGNVILAINGQSQTNGSALRPGNVTLDGVLFESRDFDNFLGAFAIQSTAALSLPSGTTTGDAAYDTFLTHVAFANTANATNTANTGLSGTDVNVVFPILGLTTNSDYLVQVWYTDERNGNSNRVATFGDNETVESLVNVPATGANGFGSFVVGTFTADATTQDLRIAIANAPRSHVTGLLVREVVAVPEPSAFFAIAMASTVIGSRRRKSKRD
jgi:hypothetical protein